MDKWRKQVVYDREMPGCMLRVYCYNDEDWRWTAYSKEIRPGEIHRSALKTSGQTYKTRNKAFRAALKWYKKGDVDEE